MLDTSLTMMGVLVSDISVLRTLFRLKNVSDTIVNGLGWIARFLRRLNLMKPPMRLKITTQSGLRIIRLIQHYWKKKAVTNEKCLSTAAGDDELKICTLYLCQGCVEISICMDFISLIYDVNASYVVNAGHITNYERRELCSAREVGGVLFKVIDMCVCQSRWEMMDWWRSQKNKIRGIGGEITKNAVILFLYIIL